MRSLNPIRAWRAMLALPNTSPLKTMTIAFVVALTCSILVSLTAVGLKPLREANRLGEGLLSLTALLQSLGVDKARKTFIERTSGAPVKRDLKSRSDLSVEQDLAGLVQIEDVLTVYEVRAGERLEQVILPIRGVGYKSMMKGYLALEADLNTIAALTFYEQDETPGMGARIMEPEWQAQWADRQTMDDSGEIRIEVVKGRGQWPFEVDGISGATYTGWGVTDLVRFWLGPDGYGPYLARLNKQRESGS